MVIDVNTAPTVLAPPSGADVTRDLVYRVDGERTLHLDVYRPPWGTVRGLPSSS